ncbi:hypothetical protein PCE1_002135 [Barthelona sp. PCE]
MSIVDLRGLEVYDSRGNPTTSAFLTVAHADGTTAIYEGIAPSGASTGVFEALELRDKTERCMGKGVQKAVENINTVIKDALIGKSVDLYALDQIMFDLDGTPNKSNLGANAILPVSMAISKADAHIAGLPLWKYLQGHLGTEAAFPIPCVNVINGGEHAGNTLGPQEIMLVPEAAETIEEAIQMSAEVFHHLKNIVKKEYSKVEGSLVGDEGGIAPMISDTPEALALLCKAIESAGYTGKIKIAMDVASSEFYDEEKKVYDLTFKCEEHTQVLTSDELVEEYVRWVQNFPIISIEDPFDQKDWAAWSKLVARLEETGNTHCQVVGDDLTVTNVERIQKAIDTKACNALLCKINQIGSISESISAIKLCIEDGWKIMVSHRSGETEDAYIAHLATAVGNQIKTGSMSRSDRMAKYNELLRISAGVHSPLGLELNYAKW